MKIILVFICLFISVSVLCQEQVYFSEVYNPMENFARGRGIVADGEVYYCLTNTDDPSNTWQSFLLMKLDKYGEIIQQELFHLPGHALYPGSVGGTLKKTNDGNFVFAYHADGNGLTYSSLVKFDDQLDTIWKQNYSTEYLWTMTMNCNLTSDGGFILCGSVKPEDGEYWDFILLKTDSEGHEQWHEVYGTTWSEHGQNVVQTPDGGYLTGGYFWKPGIDHSLDAMVVKTDSLGNEEWTKYYGNPDVDDDMAFVALATDGNYLVATVYGEYIWTNEERAGRIYLIKIDENGDIVWENKMGETRYGYYMKNLKQTDGNYYVANGWSEVIDTTIPFVNYPGWIFKF
ncbi:MAG: hypothetical protein R2764_12455 [Bacteroidales bacterium]